MIEVLKVIKKWKSDRGILKKWERYNCSSGIMITSFPDKHLTDRDPRF